MADWDSLDKDAWPWIDLGDAKGLVSIPEKKALLLFLGNTHTLPPLHDLQPDHIQAIHLSNNKQLGNLRRYYYLQHLYAEGCNISDTDMCCIRLLPHLKLLNLSNNTQLTGSGLVNIAAMRDLWALFLAATNIDDASLAIIPQMRSLRLIDLTSTYISDDGITYLGNLLELEELYIANTDISCNGILSLERCKKLRRVTLDYNIYNNHAESLKTTFPQCTFIPSNGDEAARPERRTK